MNNQDNSDTAHTADSSTRAARPSSARSAGGTGPSHECSVCLHRRSSIPDSTEWASQSRTSLRSLPERAVDSLTAKVQSTIQFISAFMPSHEAKSDDEMRISMDKGKEPVIRESRKKVEFRRRDANDPPQD
ncbi:hypothetical protein I302_100268 [Kwoniella bestiolae CBS 10118]|uniref:Uncharacterized protein n=1 Tax=Kwoniella bestiolae CBS 10118 TaxID=1296100 RepID=A0A1B9G4M7_9TREE|nr:hypothetical protein I302_03640 [Kwoniella bestiolae CBS 10118]OCF25963.1 hypothetical protein I302_03640 [Kwoniella bestiolae CBS 10118]